jgi:membrane-bound lytic murein transglycosylase B
MRFSGFLAAILATAGTSAGATVVESSLRPQLRSTSAIDDAVTVVLSSNNLYRSPRPVVRPDSGTPVAAEVIKVSSRDERAFQNWIGGFKRRARAQGISDRVLEDAFRGVTYDLDVIKRDRNQSEFTKTIREYLDSAVSDTRIRNGKDALRKNARTLDAIERHFGVEKEVVVAVWGLESAYGSFRGKNDIIRSLSTLAFDGRRGAFFEEQLIAALKILQNGDTTPRQMTGSWAGAMGHTQFMPTSYLAYAVDFTGDRKRDIWSDDPTDALASTAAYLKRFGWIKGQPWGVEVQLPKGFNFALADRGIQRMPSQWAQIGIVDMNGRAVRDYGAASILLPAGGSGAAFMIFKNFEVIERYNTADAYVIGVGHLSDRIKGGPAIRASWPRGDRALSFAERKEMQKLLTRRGFDTQGVDGRIGPKTISAVRAFQQANGLTPDGYASLKLLRRLR